MSDQVGRPSLYTPELASLICAEIAAGRSVRNVCDADDMPCASSVFNWLVTTPAFLEQYKRAREIQAEAMADEILDIADDARNDWMERELKDGRSEVVCDHEHINRSRLRVDARKWVASKLLPKKYGDKIQHTGDDGGPIQGLIRVEFVKA